MISPVCLRPPPALCFEFFPSSLSLIISTVLIDFSGYVFFTVFLNFIHRFIHVPIARKQDSGQLNLYSCILVLL